MRNKLPCSASQPSSQKFWSTLVFFSMTAIALALAALHPYRANAAALEIQEPRESEAADESEATDRNFLGGSSDILVVKPEDARIVALTQNALLEIIIEPSIYQVFWDGVMDGTFQYLSINDFRFFVTYSPHAHAIYAYDWLGLQYLVSARPMGSSH